MQNPSDWLKYQLTQDQVDQYWTDGYISGIKVLADEECDIILKDYEVFLVSVIIYSIICFVYVGQT